MIPQRLYLQIYLTIVAALALTVITTSFAFSWLSSGERPSATAIALSQRAVAQALPPAMAPASEHVAVLEQIGAGLRLELAVFSADGDLIAAHPSSETSDWSVTDRDIEDRSISELRLPDGRMVVARVPFPGIGGAGALLLVLASIAAAIAAASYPFVRRLTGRLERLQSAVVQIGEGELGTRAQIEGSDEIAALAQSFNNAADRIEALIEAHRVLLANTSHELRTPLSRVRLGIAMFQETGERARLVGVQTDIAQLDHLIDEILTVSRLDAGSVEMESDIDLLGLAAEECAYFGVAVEGEPAPINGNRDLLRRMVRNLVANAQRHGAPPIRVEVYRSDGKTLVSVRDGGGGVPPEEREKVFERFYRGKDRQDVEGHGLGLSLVRQIAVAHGGGVVIVEGETSEFVVTL